MSGIKVGDLVCDLDKMVCGTVESKIEMDILGDQNDLLIVASDHALSLFQGKDVFVTYWARGDRKGPIGNITEIRSKIEKIAARPQTGVRCEPDLSFFNVQQARAKLSEARQRLRGLHAANALEVKAEVLNMLAQAMRLLF